MIKNQRALNQKMEELIAVAQPQHDRLTAIESKLDAIMAQMGVSVPAPGDETAPDQPSPPETAPAIVQGRPPAEVIPEPVPADPEPKAAKKKG